MVNSVNSYRISQRFCLVFRLHCLAAQDACQESLISWSQQKWLANQTTQESLSNNPATSLSNTSAYLSLKNLIHVTYLCIGSIKDKHQTLYNEETSACLYRTDSLLLYWKQCRNIKSKNNYLYIVVLIEAAAKQRVSRENYLACYDNKSARKLLPTL